MDFLKTPTKNFLRVGDMLVPFMVDDDVLCEDADDDQVRLASSYQRIIDVWRRLGVLVIPAASINASSVASKIAALPVRHRKIWQVALQRQRLSFCQLPQGTKALFDSAGNVAVCASHADLAFVEDVKAVVLDIPAEDPSGYIPNIDMEICRYDCSEGSRSVAAAEEISSLSVPSGENVEAVWLSRFASLAKFSKHIAIVDRYAVESMISRRDGKSGLGFILNKFTESNRKHSIHIYTSFKEKPVDEVVGAVRSCVNDWKLVQSVYVHAVQDVSFASISHGRYVRFDDIVAVIDVGVEIFQGTDVYRQSDFTIKHDPIDRKTVEQKLRQAGQSYQIL